MMTKLAFWQCLVFNDVIKLNDKSFASGNACLVYVLMVWCMRCQFQCIVGASIFSISHEMCAKFCCVHFSLQWRQNGCDSISNHETHDCLLNGLFKRWSKKTWKLRVTGLCVGNSPGTGEFPAQMASNAENVSIWWLHHVVVILIVLCGWDLFKLNISWYLTIRLRLSPCVNPGIQVILCCLKSYRWHWQLKAGVTARKLGAYHSKKGASLWVKIKLWALVQIHFLEWKLYFSDLISIDPTKDKPVSLGGKAWFYAKL